MALDHEAIYKAYAGTVVSIDDTAGAFDASGNSVTLDQSLDRCCTNHVEHMKLLRYFIPNSKNWCCWYYRHYL